MLLNQVTKGRIKRPIAAIIHGPDGIGKTSLAANAPNPIFILTENGTDEMEVARFPLIKKWGDFISALKELCEKPHDFKTVVVDCLDGLEPMLFREVCASSNNAKNIELAMGGFGKGYVEANRIWGTVKDMFEELREKKNMNLIFIVHSAINNFFDPQTQVNYQRYELKLQKGASALWREYVDAVFFCNYEVFTKQEGSMTRTFSDGARIMYTERRPGWDAKNRFGLPLKLDLSWDTLTDAIANARPMSHEAVIEKINGLLTLVSDEELRSKVISTIESAKGDTSKLQAIANRLAIRVGES